MIKKVIILSAVLFFTIGIKAQKKFKIPGQDPEYPLYTEIDTADLRQFEGAFKFPMESTDKIFEFRDFLWPYIAKLDPFAEFLLARTFDLYPYGFGDSISADYAMVLYKRAADRNLAEAENFLYNTYKSGFMTLEENDSIAYIYLKRFMLHGDSGFKARGYRNLASMYYRGDFYNIKADTLKTIENLELSLKFDSTDTWTIDFLAGLYADQGDYDKAIRFYLKSDNDQSRLKVANWFINGIHVEKDFDRGLGILLKELRKNPNNWEMRTYDALEMINRLYCKKKITRAQLGDFYKPGYCNDY